MDPSTALQVFVSPLLGVVFEILGSLIQNEIGLVLGVSKELEKLSNILSTIQDVLEDAEIKQIDDKTINNWLRKLKDLVYEAEDILDECATEAFIPESSSDIIVKNSSCNTQVTSPSGSTCFNFKGIKFRRSLGKRIKNLLKKFDDLAELRKFHLNSTPKHVESGRNYHQQTTSTLKEPQVYGREEEKKYIANLLLEERDELSVSCIVGMGGLGKTTLAQLVYNDVNITNHFQLKCWVCVSDDFVLEKLLKSIFESITKTKWDLKDLDPLECRVKEILSGKKFLLVLDDVWNEDQTKWYNMKSLLTCGGRGSSIIVTTRLDRVALLTSTLPIQRLGFLSEENCWTLFKHYAFNTENNEYHQKFEEIGKEIVKKCRGVPLAAKALGGLLCFKKTKDEWLFVRDSALWDLPQDVILPALRVSYNHLPPHLKQCFSYCSIFPKDYEIVKEDLIHLWMANGFVQTKGSMGLEDIGNQIFKELLFRSFFQEARKNEDGDIVRCKMHDLVHDLACSITVNECRVVEVGKDENAFKRSTRHLSLDFGYSSSSTSISNSFVLESPSLRTLLLKGNSMLKKRFLQGLTYSNLKFLRVLNLGYLFDMKKLPVSIGNLKHLRYLDLSYCIDMRSLPDESICNLRNLQVLKLDGCESLEVLPESICNLRNLQVLNLDGCRSLEVLPESICNLRNLQVLKLDGCYRLQVLPVNMRKLTNLRHLGIKRCNALRQMPVGMGSLSCLRTLSMFVVAPGTGHGITELQGLDHLSGELTIQGLEHVRSSKDAKSVRAKQLRVLSLNWSVMYNETIEEVASIGEGLQPHPNIRVLELNGYNGLKFPSWMSHSCLPNLVEISLRWCRRCEHLPPLGQLPLLKVLRIDGMDSVKCIGDEFYGDHLQGSSSSLFPSLRELEICIMPNLEEWCAPSSSSTQEEEENIRVVFSSLECLKLESCPKLRTLPTTFSSSLKILKLINCNEMVLESSSSLVKVVITSGCLQKLEIREFKKIKTLPKVFMENLPSTLTDLNIWGCRELVCLPEGVMQNLTSLHIKDCPSLKVLPELGSKNNTALRTLHIEYCDGLTSVSDCLRHLTALEDLIIGSKSPELEFLPYDFQDLTSLRYVEFRWLPQMTCLPEGLKQVAGTLESLSISGCEGMTSLPDWMDKFTSLQRLSIYYCENLKVLPEEVLHLTSLQHLSIQECHPDMHRRYAKETGEDWHKIAHIPNLHISPPLETEHGIGGGGKRWMKCNMIPCFSSSSSSSSTN